MGFVISLDQVTPADASRVGGKAYNCARLKQKGFPVPEDAAVVAEAMGSAAALASRKSWEQLRNNNAQIPGKTGHQELT